MPLSCNINPNQNLIIAWLFSELYFCKESKFRNNQEFKDIVYNEVEAALSLMDAEGELSLSEDWPLVKDSNYGGYSSVILYAIAQLWDNKDWTESLKSIGKWLYKKYPIEHPWNTKDDYPNWVKDRHYASNLAERIASWYAAGISTEYSHKWSNFIIDKFPDYDKSLPLKFYQLKTIPTNYYYTGFEDIGYDYPTIIETEDNLRIIWRHVKSITTYGNELLVKDNTQINLQLKKGDSISVTEAITNRLYEYSAENDINKITIIDYNHPFFKQ